MNWARIKTALIILLLGCNLVLLFVYFESERARKDSKVSEKVLLEEITRKLERQGVTLENIEVPKKDELYVLKISDRKLNFDEEKKKFEQLGLRSSKEDMHDLYLYSYNTDSSFDILYYGSSEGIPESTYEKALQTAERFAGVGIEHGEFKYSNHQKLTDGSYEFYFEQSFNNIRILDGYMIVRVKGDKVLSLSRKALNLSEDKTRVQKLIPYSLALYRLYASIEEKEEKTKIVEMNLVQELIKNAGEENLVSGEPFVYYRFVSDNGEKYFIDAMQNEDLP